MLKPVETPIVEVSEEEQLDEEALIEQRRKRREAIKAKYRGSATPSLMPILQAGNKSENSTSGQQDNNTLTLPAFSTSTDASPSAFEITNDQDLANGKAQGDDNDGPSAADYDPTMDMQEDQQRDNQRVGDEVAASARHETLPTTEQDVAPPAQQIPVEDKSKKSKDDFDMFADDDDDDMFAEDPTPNSKPVGAIADVAVAVPIQQAKELDIGMLDNWDDIEGYYKVILGELLNGRYHVQANLGKGMFSGVVRATDVTTKRLVAIKLIRNNETM